MLRAGSPPPVGRHRHLPHRDASRRITSAQRASEKISPSVVRLPEEISLTP